ncbi:MAG: hypothetical protein JSR61_07585 [Proteobacteria bacterium]|nr:hypothetical protein [Pseudomonadota bacterium]
MEAAMVPRYNWPEQPFSDEAEKPGVFWVLVAAGLAAFLGMLLAINAGSPSDCKAIADNAARLHCFDAATQTLPAKGAPISSH